MTAPNSRSKVCKEEALGQALISLGDRELTAADETAETLGEIVINSVHEEPAKCTNFGQEGRAAL